MKIAISIPDKTHAKADALARRWGVSRSAVFARALDAYEPPDGVDPLTEAANRFADSMTDEMVAEQAAWLRVGSETVLKHTEW